MKILVMSDLHSTKEFPIVKDIDLLLLLGDIPWQTVEKIDKAYACKKFGVLGNHDRWDTYRNTGIEDLHAKKVEWGGITLAGFGGAPRYNWKEDGQYEEYEAEAFMQYLEKVDIFIAHSNPSFKTNGNSREGHRGFESFGKYIKTKEPKLFFHGHLHDPYVEKIGATALHSVYLYKELNNDLKGVRN